MSPDRGADLERPLRADKPARADTSLPPLPRNHGKPGDKSGASAAVRVRRQTCWRERTATMSVLAGRRIWRGSAGPASSAKPNRARGISLATVI
jgi:hypothetical protein